MKRILIIILLLNSFICFSQKTNKKVLSQYSFKDSIGIYNSKPLAPFHYGNNITMPSTSITQEPGIMVRTNYASGPTTNPHSFVDASVFSRDNYAMASFDCAVNINGSGIYGHLAAHKSVPIFTGGGTTGALYNYYSGMNIATGTTVTTVYNNYVGYATGGTGTVTTNYGYYCADLNLGSNKWAFYADGTSVKSFFGGGINTKNAVMNNISDTASSINTQLMPKKWILDQLSAANKDITNIDTTFTSYPELTASSDTLKTYNIPSTGKYAMAVGLYPLANNMTYASASSITVYFGSKNRSGFVSSFIHINTTTLFTGGLPIASYYVIKNLSKNDRIYVRALMDFSPDAGNIYSTLTLTIQKL